MLKLYSVIAAVFFLSSLSFTSCLTPKKMDAYVAAQFNNELPKPDRRTDSSISVTSPPSDPHIISVTERKSKDLPLIVYWKYDYRHTCVLNPAIGVSYFRKSIYQQSNKLKQKLNGKQLELTVEQIPRSFALVDKGHMVLLLIHWHKLYVEADSKDVIVAYRVLQNGSEVKSGRITVNNIERNRGIRFAQSWQSSSSEFLSAYNVDMTEMTKTVVNKLLPEL